MDLISLDNIYIDNVVIEFFKGPDVPPTIIYKLITL